MPRLPLSPWQETRARGDLDIQRNRAIPRPLSTYRQTAATVTHQILSHEQLEGLYTYRVAAIESTVPHLGVVQKECTVVAIEDGNGMQKMYGISCEPGFRELKDRAGRARPSNDNKPEHCSQSSQVP